MEATPTTASTANYGLFSSLALQFVHGVSMEKMIFLFFILLGIMALFLCPQTLSEDEVIVLFDLLKQERFRVMVRSVKAILLAVVVSATLVITMLHFRSSDAGSLDLAGQVIQANMTVAASATGFVLIGMLLFDRLYPIVTECRLVRHNIEVEERKVTRWKDDERLQLNALKQQITSLKTTVRKLEYKVASKIDEWNAVDQHVMVLRMQFEELKLKYDHSVEYNQNLRNQLELFDQKMLEDDGGWSGFDSELVVDYGDIKIPWAISTSNKGNAESSTMTSEFENGNTGCEHSCSGYRVLSSPRHRRPIYLHL